MNNMESKNLQELSRTLAESSLAMFCTAYDDILATKNLKHGPKTGTELNDLMKEYIFGPQDNISELTEETYIEENPEKEPRAIVPENSPIIEEKITEEKITEEKTTEEKTTEEKTTEETTSSKAEPRDIKKILKDFVFKKEDGKNLRLDLPFLPTQINYANGCQCLSVNGSLYSPCMTRTKKDELFCASCIKKNTAITEGTLEIRNNMGNEFVSPGFKKSPITFGTYCEKRGITREWVEKWLEYNLPSVKIPDSEWKVNKKKARRFKKSTDTSSDEESSVVSSAPAETPVEEPVAEPVAEKTTPVEEPVAEKTTVIEETVAEKTEETLNQNFSVIKQYNDFELIKLNEETDWDELFDGYIRIRDKFYGFNNEDNTLYNIKTEKAPYMNSVDDFEEIGTWHPDLFTYTLDNEEQHISCTRLILACREILNTDDETKVNKVLDFLSSFDRMTTKLLEETKICVAVKRWKKKEETKEEETKEKAKQIIMNWKKLFEK